MEERDALKLGALLHDIGKLLQRTGSVKLTPVDRKMESTCCPRYKGKSSHTYVLYTMRFFHEIWPNVFPLAEILATFHHCPDACSQPRLAKLVALADCLASGERHGLEEDAPSGSSKDARLICLFNSLNLNRPCMEKAHFPLRALSPDLSSHFPEPGATLGYAKAYNRLWEQMQTDLKRVDLGVDFSHLYTQVQHIMEIYTLFVPSGAHRNLGDISLFHHSKATAGIATCLYDLNLREAELDSLLKAFNSSTSKDNLQTQAMWLVGADISGIQDFIYGMASRGALKVLRGRSIYLQLLSDAVALRLMDDFKLSASNLLFSGGGHFYLLVPATEDAVAILQRTQDLVDTLLVRPHRGQLALCLAWEPILFQDLSTNPSTSSGARSSGFAGVWERLGEQLDRKQRAKFTSIVSSPARLQDLMGPFIAEGDEVVCSICGEPLALSRQEETRCCFCQSLEQLSMRVARGASLRIDVSLPPYNTKHATSYEHVLQSLGVRIEFLRPEQAHPKAYLLNRTDFMQNKLPFQGFRFLAKHTPLSEDGDIASLEELAGAAEGISNWGVLCADVDHLGYVFRSGLQGTDRSVSRVSMLSYLLSLYFSTHIEHIAQREPYRSNISVIYAGGDDLFVVGSWSSLRDFAQAVQKDFFAFSAQRLTLSAGIFLAPSIGYPIGRAGRLSREAEYKAKERGGDLLAVFDEVIPWRALPEIHDLEKTLMEIMGKGAPRTLLGALYHAYEEQQFTRSGELAVNPIWRLFHAFRRLVERDKSMAHSVTKLEQMLVKDLWLREYGPTAIRWVDYLTKTK